MTHNVKIAWTEVFTYHHSRGCVNLASFRHIHTKLQGKTLDSRIREMTGCKPKAQVSTFGQQALPLS